MTPSGVVILNKKRFDELLMLPAGGDSSFITLFLLLPVFFVTHTQYWLNSHQNILDKDRQLHKLSLNNS